MTIRRLAVAVVLVALAAGVRAQEPAATTRDVVSFSARVERLDPFSRSLTLKTADGLMHSVYVAREVKAFDDLKSGDTVRVKIAESVIVAAQPGAKLTPPVDTTAAAKKESEQDVLQQLKAVVRIEEVDRATRVVTYTAGDNRKVTRYVADSKLLEGINPGDVIEITYTRARAIEIEKQH